MADKHSPESVGEHAMFVSDAAPFTLPVPRPVAQSVAAVATTTLEPEEGGPAGPSSAQALYSSLSRSAGALAAWRGRVPSAAALLRALDRAVATELDRGIAFILAPVLLAGGALLYFSGTTEPGRMPLVAGAVTLALCAHASRSRPVLHLVFAAGLLGVFGAVLASAETWRAGTSMLGGQVTTQLSGRVAEVERLPNGRVRLTIDVTGTERPVLRYAPERVRVSARRVPEGVAAGSTVSGLVRLMPPSGPVRPGGYDFSFESYFDGIGASGFFLRGPEAVVSSQPQPLTTRLHASVERARHAIAGRIRDRIGGAEGEIAAALVVGVRAGIPDDVSEALRRAGIYHIISISGLHMALVAGTIMVLLRMGFALFPDFASRYPVKKYAAVLALAGIAGYLFISGGEVAAQRSFIMLAVMLTAVLFDRAALTLRNLAIAAIVVIVLSPHEVVGPSFQMSFAATAALVGAYAAWSDWRTDHPAQVPASRPAGRRLVRYLALAAAGLAVTSIVAGGATAVYAAWHFQQMPSLGLFTNLAAMPIVSAVVMPSAVLAALAMPFGLDGLFLDAMGLGLWATVAIATWFSERSPTDIVGLVPASSVAVLTVALLIATICSTWLRAAAIPVAVAGLMLLFERPDADLFVSEDGRLVGLDAGRDRMAVNRSRPNEFTVENWKRAMRATDILRPEGKQERTSPQTSLSSPIQEENSGRPVDARPVPEQQEASGSFVCAEGLCLARHASGAIVAHALDAAAALDACPVASVIVIDDATAKNLCRWKDVLVVTKRDLALNGSAAITFSDNSVEVASAGGTSRVEVTLEHAIRQPFRPWHEQRRFSREARGLPPYRPAPRPAVPADALPTARPDTASPEDIENAQ